MKKLITVFLTLVLVVSVFPNIVFAQPSATGSAKREEILKRIEQRKQQAERRKASISARVGEKLDRVKLRVCLNKQRIILRRSNNAANRAEKHFRVFEEIAQRVDNYYQNKLVPSGVTIENYDQLKSDMATQKDEVNALIEAAKEVAKNFNCEGDDPKGQLSDFRESMRAVIEAMKDYRTTIKNFIVAVRTANANSQATSSAEAE